MSKFFVFTRLLCFTILVQGQFKPGEPLCDPDYEFGQIDDEESIIKEFTDQHIIYYRHPEMLYNLVHFTWLKINYLNDRNEATFAVQLNETRTLLLNRQVYTPQLDKMLTANLPNMSALLQYDVLNDEEDATVRQWLVEAYLFDNLNSPPSPNELQQCIRLVARFASSYGRLKTDFAFVAEHFLRPAQTKRTFEAGRRIIAWQFATTTAQLLAPGTQRRFLSSLVEGMLHVSTNETSLTTEALVGFLLGVFNFDEDQCDAIGAQLTDIIRALHEGGHFDVHLDCWWVKFPPKVVLAIKLLTNQLSGKLRPDSPREARYTDILELITVAFRKGTCPPSHCHNLKEKLKLTFIQALFNAIAPVLVADRSSHSTDKDHAVVCQHTPVFGPPRVLEPKSEEAESSTAVVDYNLGQTGFINRRRKVMAVVGGVAITGLLVWAISKYLGANANITSFSEDFTGPSLLSNASKTSVSTLTSPPNHPLPPHIIVLLIICILLAITFFLLLFRFFWRCWTFIKARPTLDASPTTTAIKVYQETEHLTSSSTATATRDQ